MARIERKYLAHYLDANCNPDADASSATVDYQRIGQDLEAFAEELNPQVEIRKNILGEQTVIHNGYEVQSSVEPFYAEEGNALYDKLVEISNNRHNGDECRTTRVEAFFKLSEGNELTCEWAYREDCWIVPQTFGGDTSGIQIPFQILNSGNRVKGKMAKGIGGKWEFTKDT